MLIKFLVHLEFHSIIYYLVSSIQPVVSQTKSSNQSVASAAGEHLNKFEIDKIKQKEVSILSRNFNFFFI